jgi:Trk K+ transport system NAD-binding subunit
VAGRNLRDANLPKGVVVAGLVDPSHHFRVPHGNSVLEPGFRAILFGRPSVRTQIQVLFRG